MKKILPVFLILLISGCKKDYNNVVDVPVNNFQVSTVITPGSFTFNSPDSLLTVALKFKSVTGLKSVYFDVYNTSNSKLNSDAIELLDDGNISSNGDTVKGDNIFSNKFPMSQYYSNGDYTIKYFVASNDGVSKLVAQQVFKYSNSQPNVAPVISDLSAPSKVTTRQTFTPTLKVSDLNGSNDIDSVYCQFYSRGGNLYQDTHGNTKFLLFDDGNSQSGDQVANDGTFTFKFSFTSDADTGTWTMKYHAVDMGQKVSNEISKDIYVEKNYVPVIANLTIPDTVSINQQFKFTVSVSDSNGLSDISSVYYELYKPDGTQVVNSNGISKFPLSDKGDASSSGDVTANDGIYTNELTFPTGVNTGDWTFKFHAVDNANKLSNEISKKVTVK